MSLAASAPGGPLAGSAGGRLALAPAVSTLLTAGALCVLAPAAPGASALAAQTTVVSTVSGLQFGVLIPGVSTRVPPTDAARRAEVAVLGLGNRVDVRLILPTQMTSIEGNALPLAFANGDGATSTTRAPTPVAFDPRTTIRINLNSDGTATRIFLGGTAAPPATQPAGIYTATVSVVITGAN